MAAPASFVDKPIGVTCSDAANLKERNVERRRIFWRGDRLEWILARGFHGWLVKEITDGRTSWPGATLPAPLGSLPERAGAADS